MTNPNNIRRASRRLGAAAALAAGAVALAAPAMAEGELTVVSWGGALQDAQRTAWFEPIAEEMGITVKEDTVSGIADVRTQVQSGNVTWDLVELGSSSCVKLAEEGALEPLNLTEEQLDGVDPAAYSDTWVPVIYYATVIGWNTDFVETPPSNWAEFFDGENFPGARSLFTSPASMLEIALLADGVAPADVYPIDIDRAFAKLEEIKPDVLTWWSSGAQSAQLVLNGEVDMVAIWNGRIQAAMADGANADFTFNQQVLNYDCMVIPKGAPNAELAREVVAKFISADYQARLPQHINYGPTNAKAFDTGIISDELAAQLPSSPENMENALVLDPAWWIPHIDELTERYTLLANQ